MCRLFSKQTYKMAPHWDSLAHIMLKTKSKRLRPSPPNAPSPTDVNDFLSDRWLTTTCPTKCIVPGQTGNIIGYKDYYFESEHVLCTQAFLVAAASTTSGALNLTKKSQDDEGPILYLHPIKPWPRWWHLGKILHQKRIMQHDIARPWCIIILFWHRLAEWNADIILAWITLLLIGVDACTPYIINKVWGEIMPTDLF